MRSTSIALFAPHKPCLKPAIAASSPPRPVGTPTPDAGAGGALASIGGGGKAEGTGGGGGKAEGTGGGALVGGLDVAIVGGGDGVGGGGVGGGGV